MITLIVLAILFAAGFIWALMSFLGSTTASATAAGHGAGAPQETAVVQAAGDPRVEFAPEAETGTDLQTSAIEAGQLVGLGF